MIKNRKRAMRRHHRDRMYRHVFRKFHATYFYDSMYNAFGDDWTAEEIHLHVSRHRDNIKACSCWMCMNERHNPFLSTKERLTMQERRENERFKYEMLEIAS